MASRSDCEPGRSSPSVPAAGSQPHTEQASTGLETSNAKTSARARMVAVNAPGARPGQHRPRARGQAGAGPAGRSVAHGRRDPQLSGQAGDVMKIAFFALLLA